MTHVYLLVPCQAGGLNPDLPDQGALARRWRSGLEAMARAVSQESFNRARLAMSESLR